MSDDLGGGPLPAAPAWRGRFVLYLTLSVLPCFLIPATILLAVERLIPLLPWLALGSFVSGIASARLAVRHGAPGRILRLAYPLLGGAFWWGTAGMGALAMSGGVEAIALSIAYAVGLAGMALVVGPLFGVVAAAHLRQWGGIVPTTEQPVAPIASHAPATPRSATEQRTLFGRSCLLGLAGAAVAATTQFFAAEGGLAAGLISMVAYGASLVMLVGLLMSTAVLLRDGPSSSILRTTFITSAIWLWICAGPIISTSRSGPTLFDLVLVGPIGALLLSGPAVGILALIMRSQ